MSVTYVVIMILLFVLLSYAYDKSGALFLHPLLLIPIVLGDLYLSGDISETDAAIICALILVFYKVVLRIKAYYKNNGVKNSYFKDGKVESSEIYVKGKRTGVCKHYYENGNLKNEETYKDDLKNGISKYYFENSQVERIEHYQNGLKNGICQIYYENGQLKSIEPYENDFKHGTSKYYFENGQLKSVETYKFGRKDGICQIYYENGQLSSEEFFRNGKRSGIRKFFSENGILQYEETYENDYKQGVSTYYYENGDIESEKSYVNGYLSGLSKQYYANKAVKSLINYKNNKKDGECAYYHPSGEPALSVLCANDRICSEIKVSDVAGHEIKDTAEQGSSFTVYFYLDEQGLASGIESVCVVGGLIDIEYYEKLHNRRCDIGRRCYYNFNLSGKLASISRYDGAQKDGEEEIFDDAGNTLSKHNYVKGNAVN